MKQDYFYYDVHVHEQIATIRFRAEVAAECDVSHAEETARLIADIASDSDVNVAVLIGTGGQFTPTKAPAASALSGKGPDPLAAYAAGRSFVHALVDLDKPVIAALNGDALLVGLTIALLCDVVIAERQIFLQDMHVPLGVPASTGPLIWPLSAGLLRAKRYLLLGEPISAIEAERIGLVTELVDAGKAEEKALEYAARLAILRPEAVQYTKHALNGALRDGLTKFDAALGTEHLDKATTAK
jgi:enoyl-CoA hydratase